MVAGGYRFVYTGTTVLRSGIASTGWAQVADKVERTVFVITGNRLRDGRVVYLRADHGWHPDFDSAEQIADPAARDARVAEAQRRDRLAVTGIYPVDVGLTSSGERVLSARERLRAAGESNVRKRLLGID
jgi:hypothetical protein